MKLKKIILMSTSIVSMGLVIPTAIRVNQSNNNHFITKLRHSNNNVLLKVARITKPTWLTAPVTFTGINYDRYI